MEREEILARARLYNQQRQAVERELEKLMVSIMELNNSVLTAKGITQGEGLVPVGGGAFVKAELGGSGMLIPIGSGYLKEYGAKEAAAELAKRVELTENAVKKLRDELGKIDAEMAKLEGAYRKLDG